MNVGPREIICEWLQVEDMSDALHVFEIIYGIPLHPQRYHSYTRGRPIRSLEPNIPCARGISIYGRYCQYLPSPSSLYN